jgi:hypothetical protein
MACNLLRHHFWRPFFKTLPVEVFGLRTSIERSSLFPRPSQSFVATGPSAKSGAAKVGKRGEKHASNDGEKAVLGG